MNAQDKPIFEDSISFSAYNKDIRKYKQLSYDEQIDLAKRAKEGDRSAADKLVLTNQRFILSIAKEYPNTKMSLMDLANEGSIGMLKAIEKFDPDMGIRFLSYSVWWVRQAMIQSCYDHGDTVRLPVNRINAISKVRKIRDSLFQELKRNPTIEEICERGELDPRVVYGTLNSNHSFSLDTKISNDSELTYMDTIENDNYSVIENGLNKDSLLSEINNVFTFLTKRESEIMNLYFGLNGNSPHTLKEIGEVLDLTNERVRQIKENVLRKLRSHDKSSRLREFLDVKID